ncbi:MAG: DUF1579 domain-containing protein [Chthoniobacterales bacterium]
MKTGTMLTGKVRGWRSVMCLVALATLCLAAPAFSEEKTAAAPKADGAAASAQKPSDEEMMKQMMALAELNDNHKLLAQMAGSWDYTIKMWMDPDPKAPPTESKGTAVRKAIMDGRYFEADVAGKIPMPGPDGKMMEMDFKGRALEGYDNVKKKFVSTWADNMATGIMMSEGTYDAATKTFTFTAEAEMMPGMPMKIREVIKLVDNDHHTFDWYDNSRGTEAKTMEISYTRKK